MTQDMKIDHLRYNPEYRRIYSYFLPKMMVSEVAPLNDLFRGIELTVFDVGANQGLWTKAFLDAYGDRVSKIYLFEPLPGNLRVIEKRLDDGFFEFHSEKSILNPFAIGSENMIQKIYYDKEDSTLASINNTDSVFGENRIELSNFVEVEVNRLDDYCKLHSIESIDILKIDTEGYEWDVIQGLGEMLSPKIVKTIAFEFGIHQNRARQTFEDFWNLFSERGYKMYYFRGGNNGFGKLPIEKYSTRYEDFSRNFTLCASLY